MPNCPCNTGLDSPEHRILHCPINEERRHKIASTLSGISGQQLPPDNLSEIWQNVTRTWPSWWGIAGWWPKAPALDLQNRQQLWQKWTHWVGNTLRESEKWLWQTARQPHHSPPHSPSPPGRVRTPAHLLPQPCERSLSRQLSLDECFVTSRRRNIRPREESLPHEEQPQAQRPRLQDDVIPPTSIRLGTQRHQRLCPDSESESLSEPPRRRRRFGTQVQGLNPPPRPPEHE